MLPEVSDDSTGFDSCLVSSFGVSLGASAFGVSLGASCFVSAAGALAPAFAFASVSILAIICPTSTTSPSLNNNSVITPDSGEGTSVSTLSVEISNIVSSLSTLSPGCLCHFKMVPSIMDSPIFGINISTCII